MIELRNEFPILEWPEEPRVSKSGCSGRHNRKEIAENDSERNVREGE